MTMLLTGDFTQNSRVWPCAAMQWGTMPDMKRVATALICGVFLTAMIFAAHFTVMHWFSWKDKPIMPNVFTYFLLPGYNLAAAIPLPSPFRLGMAITFDCILFSIPVWLELQFRYWQGAESD